MTGKAISDSVEVNRPGYVLKFDHTISPLWNQDSAELL